MLQTCNLQTVTLFSCTPQHLLNTTWVLWTPLVRGSHTLLSVCVQLMNDVLIQLSRLCHDMTFFVKLSSIRSSVCVTLFTHSCFSGHLGCPCLLWILLLCVGDTNTYPSVILYPCSIRVLHFPQGSTCVPFSMGVTAIYGPTKKDTGFWSLNKDTQILSDLLVVILVQPVCCKDNSVALQAWRALDSSIITVCFPVI